MLFSLPSAASLWPVTHIAGLCNKGLIYTNAVFRSIPSAFNTLVSISFRNVSVLQNLPFKESKSQLPVAHAWNPSYSGGRDQEDSGSKSAQENSLGDPISKNSSPKKD
jgi:hypothetical protein